jgi:eukaryotic-like serine/threonine-protein kinase
LREAKILDFGLAKLAPVAPVSEQLDENGAGRTLPQRMAATEDDPNASITGVAMGTAGYMSPEQVRGEKLDPRSDLFSFGLVLYEMATGRRAFSGDRTQILHDAILNRTAVAVHELNCTVPPKLERIITKALQKDCQARYLCGRRHLGISVSDGRGSFPGESTGTTGHVWTGTTPR